jgi:hypothetical protein
MEAIEKNQCPNCWGYQVYNEKQPQQKMCECTKENK